MINEQRSRSRELIYDKSIVGFFKDYPGLIAAVLEASDRMSDKSPQKISGEGFEISLIQDTGEQRYFKLTIGEQNFFCKFTPKELQRTYGGGVREYRHLTEAMELLKQKGVTKVRTVDFKLAFEDSTRTYFVSKYESCLQVSLDEYLQKLAKSNRDEDKIKHKELEDRFKTIKMVLNSYKEAKKRNIAYDSSKDELIIFDL